MHKADLRKKYKLLRKQLSLEEIEKNSLAIANNLLSLPIWNYTYYHLFLSIVEQKEVNTDYILQVLMGKDKNIVISKCVSSSVDMIHYLLTDDTKIVKNSFNVPEPIDGLEVPVSKINVVFVPLLAYDKKGNRVGYGKGFYDQFLAKCDSKTIKIGVSFFLPEEVIDDVFTHDITLDYCVTPTATYSFL